MCSIEEYLTTEDINPMFLVGDALNILKQFPTESVDCWIISLSFWQKRQYETDKNGFRQRA